MGLRVDLELIRDWIQPRSRVLDLGCGDGSLLQTLTQEREADGLGVEIDPELITACLRRGVNVIEQDLNNGLGNFRDASFDMVVMTLALQTLRYPHLVVDEMLRVGRECIVTFPNFGYWRSRLYLAGLGRMPVSRFLPYAWYDTPNIHFCTVKDFDELCRDKGIRVLNRATITADNSRSTVTGRWPNLFAVTAVYHISR